MSRNRAKPDDRITIGIRPEHLLAGETEGQPLLTSEGRVRQRLGGQTLAYVKPDAGDDLLIIKTARKTKLKPGDRIPLTAAVEHTHFAADGRRLS
jgi:multiple sugar transport system ATP-binding protein